MYTKADFLKAIDNTIANYPAVAPFYYARDPRILQKLEAMATMLSMTSAQIEVAMAEPFEKSRDATILADAAMRGIIRKATPGSVQVKAKNNNAESFTISTGRVILDSVGRPYIIRTALTLLPGAIGYFEAEQVKHETFTHTVSGSVPFYAIQIPEASDDSYLSGLSVSDSQGAYEYRERYVNTFPSERVYHVEADDRQKIYVRLGQAGIVGTQPVDGEEFTITISRTAGEINPSAGSPFTFEYLLTPQESYIDLTQNALVSGGQNPPDMTTIRDMVKFPSVYTHNAVFLGEFNFIVRRAFPSLKFLSVWNETLEEMARGPNVDNINTLFVAVLSQDETEQVAIEPNPLTPVAPAIISEANYTATQKSIKDTILAADNSYRVRFIKPIRSEIAVTILATVSTSYVAAEIKSQIEEVILKEYGEVAAASKKGGNHPLYRMVYELLKKNVPALSDGNADIRVTLADPVGNLRPELWRYVSPTSLSVTVTLTNITSPSWGM
jgi:hypothetical protein